MENLYNTNGLIFWTENEIKLRRMLEDYFVMKLKDILRSQNRAFDFFQCEAPLLTPQELINKNYTVGDVFVQESGFSPDRFVEWVNRTDYKTVTEEFVKHLHDEKVVKEFEDFARRSSPDSSIQPTTDEVEHWTKMFNIHSTLANRHLVLRPETTMGSYAYARHLLNPHMVPKIYPPLVVWQHGKSFRKEQDQPTKFMRLKEFHQLEFQIIYSNTTKNDYSITLIPGVRDMIEDMIGKCRVEMSDRTPNYAKWTKDVIFDMNDMEVCSISRRTDFEGMDVLEVAVGTDRCIHCFQMEAEKREKREAAKKQEEHVS